MMHDSSHEPLSDDPTGSMSVLLRDWASNEQEIARRIQVEYFPRLRTMSQRLLRGLPSANTEADDVVQSAIISFCLYMRGGKATPDKSRDDVWRMLCRIAAWKASRRRQRQTRGLSGGRLMAMTDMAAHEGAARFEETLEDLTTDEIDLSLHDAIACLDAALQPIAFMVMQGMTHQEISEALDVSRRTIVRKFDLIKHLLIPLLDDEN
jgi:DNA-directed RNA polymerase specialized sigma24 family protein